MSQNYIMKHYDINTNYYNVDKICWNKIINNPDREWDWEYLLIPRFNIFNLYWKGLYFLEREYIDPDHWKKFEGTVKSVIIIEKAWIRYKLFKLEKIKVIQRWWTEIYYKPG